MRAPENEPWIRRCLAGFETLNDPVLIDMLKAAAGFLAHLREVPPVPRPHGRWLTFLGTNGVGKTLLARMIYEAWVKRLRYYTEPALGISQSRPGRFEKWNSWLRRAHGEALPAKMDALITCPFVVLDEIGAARDKTGFVTDVLHDVLSDRIGYPTVITSNTTMEQWREIDNRIASRLVRDDNLIVECVTEDYALRNRKPPQT